MDIKDLTQTERIFVNAMLIGGITFFSSLTVTGFPTVANIYAAFVGSMLAFMIQIKTWFDTEQQTLDECKKPPKGLLMLI